MRRWTWTSRDTRSGVLYCAILAAAVAGWLAGLGWLAGPATFALLGAAAAAVGADSRVPGEWRTLDQG
jgi:hypothetical protein